MPFIANFHGIKITIASPDEIRTWSHGEVTKPDTINYRTLKPEPGGLFCEKIFGPTRDWECYCGKYRNVRFKNIVCDSCGVEVTRSKVRRERFGHIELAAPVSHIWYVKGTPGRMGLLLNITPRALESVIYFNSYIVTDPGDTPLTKGQLLTEAEYRECREAYSGSFKVGMGAEAVKELLTEIDFDRLAEELRDEVSNSSDRKRLRAIERLRIVEDFRKSGTPAERMILEVIPVLPPDLRPIVQLNDGRFATADVNDLYRRVINRNNRLKRLLELKAPDIIVRNEKRMLQEAVDALIDNGRRRRPVTGPDNRPLKSLSDAIKGKEGRFHQNLQGKRVDYSGRTVIVPGPELQFHQCGLPKRMALELFKPFVMRGLVECGHARNIKGAKAMVEQALDERTGARSAVWEALRDTINDRPVILHRVPALTRLAIQALKPVLVDGKAIRMHPLASAAHNANFDGDQIAVHVPLSAGALAEAKLLMLSMNNILSPAHGKPIATPTQDLVLGCYYLTLEQEGAEGEGKCFANPEEALMAYSEGVVSLHARIAVRMPQEKTVLGMSDEDKRRKLLVTTPGKLIFNTIFPDDFPYINDAAEDAGDNTAFTGTVIDNQGERPLADLMHEITSGRPTGKGFLAQLVAMCQRKCGNSKTAEILDNLKRIGYRYATQSGTTVAIGDILIPPEKDEIIRETEEKIEAIEQLLRRGLIASDERYRLVIDRWTEAREKVQEMMLAHLDKFNPVHMIAASGASGNISQLSELGGIIGPVSRFSRCAADSPIKANLREGLTVPEYFSLAYSVRRDLIKATLTTTDLSYLMQRLIDVAHDVVVREDDCGTRDGLVVSTIRRGDNVVESLSERVVGRVAAEDVVSPQTGNLIVGVGVEISEDQAKAIEHARIREVKVRSPLTCRTRYGVCARCYGRNLATGRPAEIGDAVGIIAVQSIGEPWTKSTITTPDTAGAVSNDASRGLRRMQELFEARVPRASAVMSEVGGVVHIIDVSGTRKVVVRTDQGDEKSYTVPNGVKLEVKEGDRVCSGHQLTEGPLNPRRILRIRGTRAVQEYLVSQAQSVYKPQGVEINDKHIEVVIRQMLRKVKVDDPGETDLLPGRLTNAFDFEDISQRALKAGNRPPTAKPLILGVTRASLATDSFLLCTLT